MPPPNPIRTTGTLHERKGPRLFHASLPNGKRIIAHIPSRLTEELADLMPGEQVHLEMTEFDFSAGRIGGRVVPGA